jgi:hypothetical protein
MQISLSVWINLILACISVLGAMVSVIVMMTIYQLIRMIEQKEKIWHLGDHSSHSETDPKVLFNQVPKKYHFAPKTSWVKFKGGGWQPDPDAKPGPVPETEPIHLQDIRFVEGRVRKGGVNPPSTTPRPEPPKAMTPETKEDAWCCLETYRQHRIKVYHQNDLEKTFCYYVYSPTRKIGDNWGGSNCSSIEEALTKAHLEIEGHGFEAAQPRQKYEMPKFQWHHEDLVHKSKTARPKYKPLKKKGKR